MATDEPSALDLPRRQGRRSARRSRSTPTTPRRSASIRPSRSSSPSSSTTCPRRTPSPRRRRRSGYVVGTPEKLTYTKDINAYFRTLAAASPRVKVWTHRQERGGPRDDPRGRLQRGEPRHGSTVTKRSPPSSPTPARQPTPRRPTWCARPSRSTGSRARSIRRRPARPRCSWSWPTGSPSKTRRMSRRSART